MAAPSKKSRPADASTAALSDEQKAFEERYPALRDSDLDQIRLQYPVAMSPEEFKEYQQPRQPAEGQANMMVLVDDMGPPPHPIRVIPANDFQRDMVGLFGELLQGRGDQAAQNRLADQVALAIFNGMRMER